MMNREKQTITDEELKELFYRPNPPSTPKGLNSAMLLGAFLALGAWIVLGLIAWTVWEAFQ
jgi:hypothetical protein